MRELLATFGAPEEDAELLAQIAAGRPRRVTVLVRECDAHLIEEDSPPGAALRDRLACLMARIERDTGATVVGLAGTRDQLLGWRFDRELSAQTLLPA